MIIDEPHGYLIDGDNRVIIQFANWQTGEREVHPATEKIEYVDGPNAHEREIHDDYKQL